MKLTTKLNEEVSIFADEHQYIVKIKTVPNQRLDKQETWYFLTWLKRFHTLPFLMKKFFRDALNSALRKLGFPFLTPHPTKTAKEIGYFQKTISDTDLYEMYKRNQLAHNIVFNVALDVLSAGFQCVSPTSEEMKGFDAKVQALYNAKIHLPLLKTYLQARLYGSAGLLLGYRDTNGFDSPANSKDKIDYLFSIPHKWVSSKVPVKDSTGFFTLPLELSHYELDFASIGVVKIHASRLVHIQPTSIEDDFKGESALIPIFDVLTVLKNMDWSAGQAMFRHGAGLTTVIAADGANQEQIDAIDEVVSEINAKTVLTLPPGCKLQTDRPGALDPSKYYQVICNQIAGGSNIPLSILMGAQPGAVEASSKDRKDYADLISALQAHDITPALTGILTRFQESGQLPEDQFMIRWNTPEVFQVDLALGKLYEARAEHELAKAEERRVHTKLKLQSTPQLSTNKEDLTD